MSVLKTIEPGSDSNNRSESATTQRLENYLKQACRADQVEVLTLKRLAGGAIQENWMLVAEVRGGLHDGSHRWVLRMDALSAVQVSLTRPQEFSVLETVHHAGVRVPRPLWLCLDESVLGRPFFIMQMLPGIAAGHTLTLSLGDNGNSALAVELGANLASLHQLQPPQTTLDFLPSAQPAPALTSVEAYRNYLSQLPESFPALEWGLRWCELNAPETHQQCLLHRDYRTGNFLVSNGMLSGVLDWEFTSWGDPLEDVGWFSAPCWRFKRPDLQAGGIGHLKDFLAGYAQVSGRHIVLEELRYWQVLATLRWAVIALQQAERHLSGEQASLELALTGRLIPELELDILKLTRGEQT
ncbi:phosphotransferase family protein [Pseudomonas sp. Z3-6]|uniref:phosphotransferase family protein n=1 Tax=Pseudomonas sp. Z3-6 TaxID=2817411 RepID=UPI003DA847DE